MSTSIDYVVDTEATLDEASSLAARIIASLIDRGIILSSPQIHDYLDDGPKYATGPNVEEVADHNDCFPCGLDVEIGRAVVTPGENGLTSLTCPVCRKKYDPDEIDWPPAVGAWFDESDEGILACEQCGFGTGISKWEFEPVWGFGNLTFKFSEWFLKEEFVQELSKQLGHRIAWVKCHI